MKQNSSLEANSSSDSQEIYKFCGTQIFTTTFTSTCHLSLSWARWIQSMPAHSISWISILIFSSLLYYLLNSPFPSGLSTNILHEPLLSPIHATFPTHLILLYKTQHNLNNFLSKLNFSIVMLHHVAWWSSWGCRGTCGLHCQVKINECSNQLRRNTVSHTNWSAEYAVTS